MNKNQFIQRRLRDFYVLTGGLLPSEQIILEKVHFHRAFFSLRWGDKSTRMPSLSHLIFTNVGLLIFPYASVISSWAYFHWLQFGFLGGLVAEQKTKEARIKEEHKYITKLEKHSQLPLDQRYAKYSHALFFPADEISNLTCSPGKSISFLYRGIKYYSKTKQMPATIPEWLRAATQQRERMLGGPGTPATYDDLLTWSQRTVRNTPPWVIEKIQALQTEKSRRISGSRRSNKCLIKRLQIINTDESRNLTLNIRKSLFRRRIIHLAAGLSIGATGAIGIYELSKYVNNNIPKGAVFVVSSPLTAAASPEKLQLAAKYFKVQNSSEGAKFCIEDMLRANELINLPAGAKITVLDKNGQQLHIKIDGNDYAYWTYQNWAKAALP